MPTSEELKELMLAVAARADRQAFALLFQHFAPRVKTYLMRAGTADGQAEELTQEAMVLVWRKAALFDGERAAVSTWIFTLARNLRVDQFRRGGQRESGGEEADDLIDQLADPAPPPEERLEADRRERRLHQALARLPAEQALMVRLSFFEEQPHARIASECGIPLGTVKSRVRLAIQHLRRLLDGLES